MEETSKVKEELADSATNARLFSLVKPLDKSVIIDLVSLSVAIARYFSTTILLETSNINALLAASSALARVISLAKPVVTVVILVVFVVSAVVARVISSAKLDDTSNTKLLPVLLLELTKSATVFKFPDKSLINASSNASSVSARDDAAARLEETSPINVEIVPAKLPSLPNAVANSFNVSNAVGALSNISLIRVCTNFVVAIWSVLTELTAVGALGIPVNSGDTILDFVAIAVLIVLTLVDKLLDISTINVLLAPSATVARVISLAKLLDKSAMIIELLFVLPAILDKLLEISSINVLFAFSASVARVTSAVKLLVTTVNLLSTVTISAALAVSAACALCFSITILLETSLVNALFADSAASARYFSFKILLDASLIVEWILDSALLARVISLANPLVTVVILVVFVFSADVARVISAAKLADTSNTKLLPWLLLELTKSATVFKFPDKSLINASSNASSVSARDFSVVKLEETSPMKVVIVVEKLPSLPNALANSFNVSNAVGALSNISLIRVCTNFVVAIWSVLTELTAVGALGIPVNSGDTILDFVAIAVLIVLTLVDKLLDISTINVLLAPSATVARVISLAKLLDKSAMIIELLFALPAILDKLLEISSINVLLLLIAVTTVLLIKLTVSFKFAEISLINAVLLVSATIARFLSTTILLDTSSTIPLVRLSVAIARYFSTTILLETSNVILLIVVSAAIAREISLFNELVNELIDEVNVLSALVARVISFAKFCDTSNILLSPWLLLELTKSAISFKFPDKSLINASSKASSVVARADSLDKLLVIVPICVLIVVAKLLSSPNAADNSFNVSNAVGALSNISPMRVCTNAVVAIWVLSVVLLAVGAVGIPINAGVSIPAFVDILVLRLAIPEDKFNETSLVNNVLLDSAAIARDFSTPILEETSPTRALVSVSAAIARYFSTIILLETSNANASFSASFVCARVTSLFICVVKLSIVIELFDSAVIARIFSASTLLDTSNIKSVLSLLELLIVSTTCDKLRDTSNVNAWVLLELAVNAVIDVFITFSAAMARLDSIIRLLETSFANARSPAILESNVYPAITILLETSIVNILSVCSSVWARCCSVFTAPLTLPILVATVVAKSLSSFNAAANSFNVSNARGALLTNSLIRFCTNSVVATRVSLELLAGVGALGCPLNSGEILLAFSWIDAFTVTILLFKLEDTSATNTVISFSTDKARFTSVFKLLDTSNIKVLVSVLVLASVVANASKFAETSIVKLLLADSAVVARTTSLAKLEETSPINVVFSPSLYLAATISFFKLNDISVIIPSSLFSSLDARVISSFKLKEISWINVVFSPSLYLASKISSFIELTVAFKLEETSIVKLLLAVSALLARIISADKSVVNLFSTPVERVTSFINLPDRSTTTWTEFTLLLFAIFSTACKLVVNVLIEEVSVPSAICARKDSLSRLLDKSVTTLLIVSIRLSNILPGFAADAVAALPPICKLVTGVIELTAKGAVPVATVDLITFASKSSFIYKFLFIDTSLFTNKRPPIVASSVTTTLPFTDKSSAIINA